MIGSSLLRRRVAVVCSQPLPTCACKFKIGALVGNRIDLVARCLHAALFVAGGTRGDAEVVVVFPRGAETGGGYWQLTVRGEEARGMQPDEVSIAAAVHRRLYLGRLCRPQVGEHKEIVASAVDVSAEEATLLRGSRGVYLREVASMADALPSSEEGPLLYLVDGGVRIEDCMAGSTEAWLRGGDGGGGGGGGVVTLVVGDDVGAATGEKPRRALRSTLEEDVEAVLMGQGAVSVSIGRRPLLSSHAIILAHQYLDDLEDTRGGGKPPRKAT